ncbi:hypothetical protein niasHS_001678 [Heterodera schachtii]|uniref:PAP-associated domain-containing protein n=1 Tax=Heterodera schachtii TaxID=97005 RepID=A0ABD2KCI5_HETSC
MAIPSAFVAPPFFVAHLRPFRPRAMPSKIVPMQRRQLCTMLSPSRVAAAAAAVVVVAPLPSFSNFSFSSIPCSSSSPSSSWSVFHAFRSLSSSTSTFDNNNVPSLDELKCKNAAQIEQLSVAITNHCANSFERNKELRARVRPMVTRLGRAICAPTGRSRLVLIGSIASGMAFDASSDLDLAFVYCGANQKEQEKFLQDFWTSSFGFVRSFLEAIADTVRESCNAHPSKEFLMSQAPEIISHTYVPLIVAKFDNGTHFDIGFPRFDFQSLRNTLMIRYYMQADRRFLLLFHWLRIVFIQMGLKNSKNGLFSSYHTLLLVLHFLSQKEVPDNVLPAFCDLPHFIRDKLFAPAVSTVVQQLEQVPQSEKQSPPFWTSKCAKSVGELAVELVDYYARFDPWTTAISIANGRTISVFRQLHAERPALKVMEPFSRVSSSRSPLLGEALVVGFQFLRDQMAAGRHLTTFPSLDGLTEEFGDHVRGHGFPWAIFLDKNYTAPTPPQPTTTTEEEEADDANDDAVHGAVNDGDNELLTGEKQQKQKQRRKNPR